MSDAAVDTATIREALCDVYQDLEHLTPEQIDGIIEGRPVKLASPKGGAKIDLTELIKLVLDKAPEVAALFTMGKVSFDIWRATAGAPKPTAQGILEDYEAKHGKIPADKRREMADLAIVAVEKLSTPKP